MNKVQKHYNKFVDEIEGSYYTAELGAMFIVNEIRKKSTLNDLINNKKVK